jgi:carbon storage regulator CsrA
VKIGKDVVVTVLEIRGTQVRIGVDAPRTTTVLRQEIAPGTRTPPRPVPDVDR